MDGIYCCYRLNIQMRKFMSYQLLCSSYSKLLSICPRCLMWDFYLSPTLVGKYLMTILFIAETPTRPPIHSSPFCTLFPRYHGGLNEQTRVSLWIIILFPLVNPPRHDLPFILLPVGDLCHSCTIYKQKSNESA